MTMTVGELLDGHVCLDIECMDRIYLNGYVPTLQVGGQVVRFMRDHLGFKIPSPAIMEKIGTRFRAEVKAFAAEHGVPVLRFGKDDRNRPDAPVHRRAGTHWNAGGGRDRRGAGVPERVRRFTALSNGFAACDDPDALQAICDRLGPADIQAFFGRWTTRLPLPLTEHDRNDGYWWELSMRQIETSRTIGFDQPRHARSFVEALIADNLDLGRPDSIELIFTGKRPGHRRGRPVKLGTTATTKVVDRDTEVTINASFKHSRIKQYLKDGRALRIETVVNCPDDLRCHRRLQHFGFSRHAVARIPAARCDAWRGRG